MIKIIRTIIGSVLMALYESLGFAVILAILFMFLYLFAAEYGWKYVFKRWYESFKKEAAFRRIFLLVLYTALLLFRTLLNRDMWANPLSDVMGGWGLYGKNGNLTTEAIENMVLFTPFIVLLFCCFKEKLLGDVRLLKTIIQSIKIAFLFSLGIELSQLFLRLGTFQLSDLCYNTFGGLLGGFLYYLLHRFFGRD